MLNHNITLETLYKCLFVSHHSVMLLIDPDTGEIIDANEAACTFYQYAKEELLRLKISHINILSKEEVKREMANAAREERNHFNFRHRIKSGEIRDVEVYSTPIELEDRVYLFSVITDITQHLDLIRKKDKALENFRLPMKKFRNFVMLFLSAATARKSEMIRAPGKHWKSILINTSELPSLMESVRNVLRLKKLKLIRNRFSLSFILFETLISALISKTI